MHRGHRIRLYAVLALVVLVVTDGHFGKASAQQYANDFSQLAKDVVSMRLTKSGMFWAMWQPEEFWRIGTSQFATLSNMKMTPEVQSALNDMVKQLGSYNIVAVVDGHGAMGTLIYAPEVAMRASIQLIDPQGNAYRPLSDEELTPQARTLMSQLKPVLTKIVGSEMGQFGEGMRIFLFPGRTKAGERIADPTKPGILRLKLEDKELKWRLPLGSLMPLKKCPVDGEEVNGAWTYCPWHGAKLVDLR